MLEHKARRTQWSVQFRFVVEAARMRDDDLHGDTICLTGTGGWTITLATLVTFFANDHQRTKSASPFSSTAPWPTMA